MPKTDTIAKPRNRVQTTLITTGVSNLREFGYPACNADNILTDRIYMAFFRSMLEDNLGKGYDTDIRALIAECDANFVKAASKKEAVPPPAKKLDWQFSRNQRRHWVADGELYTKGRKSKSGAELFEIRSCTPMFQVIRPEHGYDLFHRGKQITHAPSVKQLKQVAQERSDKNQ